MRKVLNLYLNGSLFIPGLGGLADKLPDPHKTLKDLEMKDTGTEIIVSVTASNNAKINFGIPKGNVKAYTFVEVPDEVAATPPSQT